MATMSDLGDGTTRIRLAELGYDASPESQRMRAFFTAGNALVMKVLQSRLAAQAQAGANTGGGATPSIPAHWKP